RALVHRPDESPQGHHWLLRCDCADGAITQCGFTGCEPVQYGGLKEAQVVDAGGFGIEEVGDPALLLQRGDGYQYVFEGFDIDSLTLTYTLSYVGKLRN